MSEPQYAPPAAASRPSMPPVTGIAVALAILAAVGIIALLVFAAVFMTVFAGAGGEPGWGMVGVVAALIILAAVAGVIMLIVALARGYGWARFVLAAVLVTGIAFGFFLSDGELNPLVALPSVATIVLLFLPPSNRWFAVRAQWRQQQKLPSAV